MLDNTQNIISVEDFLNKFENEVNSKFSRLKEKLYSQKNIAIIKGITTESRNLREGFMKNIDNIV